MEDPTLNSKTNNVVLVIRVLIVLGLTWSIKVLWQKRKLYATACKLPGPRSLPLIGNGLSFLGKDTSGIYAQLMEYANTYPGLFVGWLGPRLFYLVSDPKYFHLVNHQHLLKKDPLYRMTECLLGQGLFSNRDTAKWKIQRKLISPAFNQQVLDRFTEVFVAQSEVLCQVLKPYVKTGEVNLMKLVTNCTLDFIFETAMGVKINAQLSESEFPEIFDRLQEMAMFRMFYLHYHSDFIFNLSSMGKETSFMTNKVRNFVKKVIDKKKIESQNHIIHSDERPAFLDLLLQIQESNNELTDLQILDETVTFMIAGSDTTAVTNCFTLTMLALHQDIQQQVFEEVTKVIGSCTSVQVEHLPKFQILERVIKETLRIFPVGLIFVRYAEQDIDIGECVIHKNCSVLFAVRHVHTNEKYWPNPFKFDPDRFLPENKDKATAFYPFVLGQRDCIGKKYGMMAMKTLIATVVRKYKIFTSYKSVLEIEVKPNVVVRPVHGFKVSFEERIPDQH